MNIFNGQPSMVCHRGANRVAPENTLAAAERAFDTGARFVELDVQVSADNIPFVLHDWTLDRTTSGTGPIADMAAADIARLDAGSWFGPGFAREPVPRLADMYRLASGRGRLYVEIKAADPDMVVDMAVRHGMLNHCFFWSQDQGILDRLKASQRPVALLIRYKDYADPAAALDRYAPAVLELTAAEANSETVALCRQAGARPLAFYPGNDPNMFRRLLAAGVELFNLNYPDVFLEVVAAA